MARWPFDEEDWKEWEKISRRYLDAVFAEDCLVADAISLEMYEMLTEWEKKYGEQSWILEKKADFADDPGEKLELYVRALRVAVERNDATLTIRLWLAELLLDEFDDAATALQVLTDGQHELLEPDQEKDWAQKYGETLDRINKRLIEK